jgi:hypothetical protein
MKNGMRISPTSPLILNVCDFTESIYVSHSTMSAYSDVNFDKDDEDAKTITGDDCSVISCDLESDVTSKKTVMTSDPPEDQFESDKEDAKDGMSLGS